MTSGRWATVAACLVLAATAGVVVPATSTGAADSAATTIDGCTAITEPGRYVLTQDIRGGGGGGEFTFISEACIRVESSDVVLDLDGHVIDGRGISDTTGVAVNASEPLQNVTVRDATITDWNRGIYLGGVRDATVRNVNASENTFGVFVESSPGTSVEEVSATHDFIGIYVTDSPDTTIESTETWGNHLHGVHRPSANEENRTAVETAPATTGRLGGVDPWT